MKEEKDPKIFIEHVLESIGRIKKWLGAEGIFKYHSINPFYNEKYRLSEK